MQTNVQIKISSLKFNYVGHKDFYCGVKTNSINKNIYQNLAVNAAIFGNNPAAEGYFCLHL